MPRTYIAKGENIDYKNAGGAAIEYHDVVPMATRIGVAMSKMQVGETGAVSVTGVYEMDAINTAAFAVGDALYWDDAAKKLTNVSAGNTPAGWCVEAKLAAGTLAKVKIG